MKFGLAVLLTLTCAVASLAQSGMTKSSVGEINVFRRFYSERTAAMREFYGEVLGLPVLPETALGGGQMIRYPLGLSTVRAR